jgi:AraC family transcriptional regulator
MSYRIEQLPHKTLAGKCASISLETSTVHLLWKEVMTRRAEFKHRLGEDYFSVQVYDTLLDFSVFTPQTVFQSWATVEIEKGSAVPEGMLSLELEGGLYLVVTYKGHHSNYAAFAQNLFGHIIPESPYELDQRPHFEVLGKKFDRNSHTSEEDIWVPVRLKRKS